MSWKDNLGPASFRGVKFFVETTEHTGGRRGVTHEYPFRDESYREDLGRQAREFSVEGYVLGTDYLAAKNALLDALEATGPGSLQHPFYGARSVAVISFRVRETRDDGGMARFSIDFEETPVQPAQPTAVPDAAGQLRASATRARASVSTAFLARYVPGVHMGAVAEMVRRATLTVDAALTDISLDVQEAATMHRRLDTLSSNAVALVETPADILASLIELFDGFGVGARPVVVGLYSFDPGPRPLAATMNREREQENFDTLRLLIQRLAVVRAAELVLDETFVSYDEAIAARTEVTDLVDEQAELVSDDTYPDLVQLRADVVLAVPGATSDLPRLLPVTPAETVPSLVLAYRLYASLELEGDLLARNDVRNPMFIMGGTPLTVLSNG